MSKTLGLALGAGGSRGVAHVGFLRALEEEGIRPDFIAGSSMGAVVGASYAKGLTPDEMQEVLSRLRAGDIMDIGFPTLGMLGLMRWTKARRLITKHLSECDFSDLKIPFCCVAVDICKGKLHVFKEGSVVDAILASSSIPTVFRPVEKDGMMLVDGGVLCRVPARQVKHMGADVVVAVDVLGPCPETEKIPNLIALVTRVYDIMDSHRTSDERRRNRRCFDLWLTPDIGDLSQYTIKYSEEAIEAGYKAGKENAEKIRRLLEE